MIKLLFVAVASVVFCSGCIGPKLKLEFETSIQQWVGKPVSELLAKSLPDKNKQTTIFEKKDGGQFITVDSQVVYDEVNPGKKRFILGCSRIFETDPSGRIVSARYEGQGCW
ncbi:MAG: hypothetical protein Q8O00_16380 [Holophaga sp.]|nr:hypothetical protein [Holophaga sp.]